MSGVTNNAESPTVTAVPAARGRARHLYEVDVVRILTFASVIAVHTTSHTVASSDIGLYGFLALAHFTRNVFFILSAFVLVYSYLHRPVPMRRFWPRRFLLVGIPYLVWSAVYILIPYLHSPHGTLGDLGLKYLGAVLTGSAWYHLYFLLVTMQVYLLFPVIMWVVRKTRGHHVMLLAISFAVQLVLTGLYMYFPAATSWINGISKEAFFSYQFFILLGAVTADHAEWFLGWVRKHRGLIGVITLLSAAAMIGMFLVAIRFLGASFYHAGTPVQPMIMVWSVAVGLGFLAVGTWWADRRKPDGLLARAVTVASDRSFGIFLAHPLVLWFLLWVGDDWFTKNIATPWLTLVVYLLVIAGAILITELARRTPLSLPMTGRPFAKKS